MRIVKAAVILLSVPVLGVVLAFVLGGSFMPPDPNFAANGGHVAPGDGILIILFVLGSLLISVPLSIWLTVASFRKSGTQNQS
jgi:hypothetical protein